jgi:mono/diheme cytochrome c family protein
MICRLTLIIVTLITAGLCVSRMPWAADLQAGEAIADEQCGTCHVAPGETVGLGQAPELRAVVPVVDWTHLHLREWFATAHPIRLSFQVTDRDLHDLRFYLMDLHDQSMLGTLGQP